MHPKKASKRNETDAQPVSCEFPNVYTLLSLLESNPVPGIPYPPTGDPLVST